MFTQQTARMPPWHNSSNIITLVLEVQTHWLHPQHSTVYTKLTSNLGKKPVGLPPLAPNYLQICYNSLSLQQWYQVCERDFILQLYIFCLRCNFEETLLHFGRVSATVYPSGFVAEINRTLHYHCCRDKPLLVYSLLFFQQPFLFA